MVRYANQTAIRDLATEALITGRAYRTGELFESVANTDTKKLLLENTTTDQTALVLEPTVRASGQAFVTKTANVTVTAAGASVTTTNKRTNEVGGGGVVVTTAGDADPGAVSGGIAYPTITIGSGSNRANAQAGDTGLSGISDSIPPGDNLTIEAQNQSGGSPDISITADYAMIPESRL